MEENTQEIAQKITDNVFSSAMSFNKKDLIEVVKFALYLIVSYALLNQAQILEFISSHIGEKVSIFVLFVATYAYKRFKDSNPT